VNWLLRLGMPVGETHKPKIQLPNAQGILECVREGLGIATLADYIAKDYPDLIQLLPDISKPFTELLFVYPVELAASLKIQALEEFLKNVD
jgi:DNA-binding transcriptional LysR family regulator